MADKRNESILESIKEDVGIVPNCSIFDNQLLLYLNSVMSNLRQLGYGPEEGFEVTGASEKWSDLITESRFNFVRAYVTLKVHLLFSVPTSSFALDFMNKQVSEYEWRIMAEVESGR